MAITTLAVITAVAAVGSAVAANKQASATKKGIKAEQRRADIQNARERRGAIRNARMSRASVESQSALTGLGGSSATAGSMSNIQSRLGENLSFLDQNAQLSAKASAANESAAKWANRGNTMQAIGSMASTTANIYFAPKPQGTG